MSLSCCCFIAAFKMAVKKITSINCLVIGSCSCLCITNRSPRDIIIVSRALSNAFRKVAAKEKSIPTGTNRTLVL